MEEVLAANQLKIHGRVQRIERKQGPGKLFWDTPPEFPGSRFFVQPKTGKAFFWVHDYWHTAQFPVDWKHTIQGDKDVYIAYIFEHSILDELVIKPYTNTGISVENPATIQFNGTSLDWTETGEWRPEVALSGPGTIVIKGSGLQAVWGAFRWQLHTPSP